MHIIIQVHVYTLYIHAHDYTGTCIYIVMGMLRREVEHLRTATSPVPPSPPPVPTSMAGGGVAAWNEGWLECT